MRKNSQYIEIFKAEKEELKKSKAVIKKYKNFNSIYIYIQFNVVYYIII